MSLVGVGLVAELIPKDQSREISFVTLGKIPLSVLGMALKKKKAKYQRRLIVRIFICFAMYQFPSQLSDPNFPTSGGRGTDFMQFILAYQNLSLRTRGTV